jgi:transposase
MRYELSDHEWTVIRPILPNKPRGIPRVDDRRILNGIFWVLRSGAPWRDLPDSYGPSTTCTHLRHLADIDADAAHVTNNATGASGVERGVASDRSSRSRSEDSSRRIRNRGNGSRSCSLGSIHNVDTHNTRSRSGSSRRDRCRC